MDSLELNKIVAAILTASVIAMVSGFVAGFVVQPPEAPEERAYVIAEPGEGDVLAGAETPEPVEESILVLLASADAAAGESVTRKCTACHTFDEGGANRVGPNLWDIVGRPIGGADGFNYSDALSGLSDQTWGYENLDAFLAAPKAWAPGTKMAYAGLKKADDRAELIAYLRGLSNDPQPLPEAEAAPEPAAETVVEAASEVVAETAAEVTGAATEAGEAVAEPAAEAGEAIAETESVSETAAGIASDVATDASDAAETASNGTEAEAAAPGETQEAAAVPASGLAAMIAAADPAAGQKVARKCRACHSFDSGGGNRVGPPLYGVLGRAVAGVEGYTYSSAFKAKAEETWNYDNMAAFLAKPREWAPGTKMAFAGLRKEEDVAAMLAYLRQQHDSPPALPE